jgi:hypothetical protein
MSSISMGPATDSIARSQVVTRARAMLLRVRRLSHEDPRSIAWRLGGLGFLSVALFVIVGPFAGILAYVAGLAVLALHATAHPTPQQRPSASGASAPMRATGPRGTRR